MFQGIGFQLFQPGFHDFMGCIAGLVKAFPQAMVGHTALVGLFPLLAHGTQSFLHFSPAQRLAFRALEQALCLYN